MDITIEVSELSRHFGALRAVDNVSFSVARGDVLGFLGPNGAGKSTTMKMITGFLEPSAGRVVVCGHQLDEEPLRLKQRTGYLPEGAPSYGEMTTLGFLDFVASIRGLTGEHKKERIDATVRLIHLDGVLHQRIETLSKGFRRRVGVAQAIIHDPEVLVLDEPTDGLDPNQKHEVRSLIKEMAAQKAIIISTHILEEVDAVCNRALIIANGKLVFEGTPGELAKRSRFYNAVTLKLAAPPPDDAQTALRELTGVAAVEAGSGDPGTLVAFPEPGSDIAPSVSALIHSKGWEVAELRVEPGQLDEVFRAITDVADARKQLS